MGEADGLVGMVQALALANSRQALIDTLKSSARKLIGADGVTVVFRDGDQCFYCAEDAIAPMFAPARFPMAACISGWVMLNAKPVAIPDIQNDSRVPYHLYKHTFIKALGMVPIRSNDPIGAVGFYWDRQYQMSAEETSRAQALADSAAVALQNVQVLENLEERVRERTERLTQINDDLRLFAGNVAHDLRSPLTVIMANSSLLLDDTDPERVEIASDIHRTAEQMSAMLHGLLTLSQVTSAPLSRKSVDLSVLAHDSLNQLQRNDPSRHIEIDVQEHMMASADEALMRIALGNLLNNAWKYTSRHHTPKIRFGLDLTDKGVAYVVQDNGAGFDSKSSKLFTAFKRFHTSEEFAGTGLGLTSVYRAITRHGGALWAESQRGEGARFFFQLPERV